MRTDAGGAEESATDRMEVGGRLFERGGGNRNSWRTSVSGEFRGRLGRLRRDRGDHREEGRFEKMKPGSVVCGEGFAHSEKILTGGNMRKERGRRQRRFEKRFKKIERGLELGC